MAVDLKSMNRKELEKLLVDAKKALLSVQAKDRRAARKAAEKAAAEFGFSLNELNDDEKPSVKAKKIKKIKSKTAGPKSKPQFANPDNTSQTWTGKGRQPNWYRDQVEKGATPDSLRISGIPE